MRLIECFDTEIQYTLMEHWCCETGLSQGWRIGVFQFSRGGGGKSSCFDRQSLKRDLLLSPYLNIYIYVSIVHNLTAGGNAIATHFGAKSVEMRV